MRGGDDKELLKIGKLRASHELKKRRWGARVFILYLYTCGSCVFCLFQYVQSLEAKLKEMSEENEQLKKENEHLKGYVEMLKIEVRVVLEDRCKIRFIIETF